MELLGQSLVRVWIIWLTVFTHQVMIVHPVHPVAPAVPVHPVKLPTEPVKLTLVSLTPAPTDPVVVDGAVEKVSEIAGITVTHFTVN